MKSASRDGLRFLCVIIPCLIGFIVSTYLIIIIEDSKNENQIIYICRFHPYLLKKYYYRLILKDIIEF